MRPSVTIHESETESWTFLKPFSSDFADTYIVIKEDAYGGLAIFRIPLTSIEWLTVDQATDIHETLNKK